MKNIDYVDAYSGGVISPRVAYVSDSEPLIFEGHVEFTVFGTVIINDSFMIKNMSVSLTFKTPVQVMVDEDSAILFHRVPVMPREVPRNEPVDDIPDMMDSHEVQMMEMFDRWLKERNIQIPLGDSRETDLEDDDTEDEEMEEEFDLDLDIDPPLVEPFQSDNYSEPDENRDTDTESDSASKSDGEETVEETEEDEEVAK